MVSCVARIFSIAVVSFSTASLIPSALTMDTELGTIDTKLLCTMIQMTLNPSIPRLRRWRQPDHTGRDKRG
jgi:uncharacterized membrane protein